MSLGSPEETGEELLIAPLKEASGPVLRARWQPVFRGSRRPLPPPGTLDSGNRRSVASPPHSLLRGLGFLRGALAVERSNLLAQYHKAGRQTQSINVEIGGFD